MRSGCSRTRGSAVPLVGNDAVVTSTPIAARVGLPRWLYVPAALGAAFVLLPLVAMVARVDWGGFGSLVTSESARDALWLSLRTSTFSTLLCVLLGVPMAAVLARTAFPGQGVLRSLVLLPLVIPPVVSGIALLYTFGRRGLLGHTLDVLGVEVAFTTAAVVMAQTFVALPFLVISLEGALRTAGQRYEVVAATLGAAPSTVFRRVTLPLEIYQLRETDVDAAVALSLVLVVVAIAIVGIAGRPTR